MGSCNDYFRVTMLHFPQLPVSLHLSGQENNHKARIVLIAFGNDMRLYTCSSIIT